MSTSVPWLVKALARPPQYLVTGMICRASYGGLKLRGKFACVIVAVHTACESSRLWFI